MLRCLVYSSRASQSLQKEDLVAILEAARHKNQLHHITGMLVFANDEFLQVLEGEEEVIEKLFTTITEDPRNRDCRVLLDRAIEQRIFSDWSMGFREMEKADLTQRPGFIEFFNPDMTPKALINPTSAAQFLLLGFRGLQLENEEQTKL